MTKLSRRRRIYGSSSCAARSKQPGMRFRIAIACSIVFRGSAQVAAPGTPKKADVLPAVWTHAPEKGQPFGNESRKQLGTLLMRKEVRGGMKRAGGNPPGPATSYSYI